METVSLKMVNQMLKLSDIEVPFDAGAKCDRRGIRSVSLEVMPGEFVMLLGRNGSGKSTLLECIAGYRVPSSGSILVGDTELGHMPPHERSSLVTLVGQRSGIGLPQHMRIGEVLALCHNDGGYALGFLRWRRREQTLEESLSRFLPHLSGRLSDQVRTLSGGELQLLSLACLDVRMKDKRPLAHALLLDEHVSSLDTILGRRVMSLSRQFCKRNELASIVVTHSWLLVREFADRIIFLEDGVLSREVGGRDARMLSADEFSGLFDRGKDWI